MHCLKCFFRKFVILDTLVLVGKMPPALWESKDHTSRGSNGGCGP